MSTRGGDDRQRPPSSMLRAAPKTPRRCSAWRRYRPTTLPRRLYGFSRVRRSRFEQITTLSWARPPLAFAITISATCTWRGRARRGLRDHLACTRAHVGTSSGARRSKHDHTPGVFLPPSARSTAAAWSCRCAPPRSGALALTHGRHRSITLDDIPGYCELTVPTDRRRQVSKKMLVARHFRCSK